MSTSKMSEINQKMDLINSISNDTIENIRQKKELLLKVAMMVQNESSHLTTILNPMLFDFTKCINKLLKGTKKSLQISKHSIKGQRCMGWVERDTDMEFTFDFWINANESKQDVEIRFTQYFTELLNK